MIERSALDDFSATVTEESKFEAGSSHGVRAYVGEAFRGLRLILKLYLESAIVQG
jgi:hypothetical protein